MEPLRGEVLTAFSMEELVYNRTLGDWRTHNGVDIAAKAGTTVLAACAGAVQTVTEDPLLGTTVVLEHDGGYQTTYANLQADPGVEVGEAVSAGQIIGAVGTTAPGGGRHTPPALCRHAGRQGGGSRRISGAVTRLSFRTKEAPGQMPGTVKQGTPANLIGRSSPAL